MRKRVPLVVGGGVVLLIASQFLDFGLGFQDGDGSSVSTDPKTSSSIVDAIVESEKDSSSVPSPSTTDAFDVAPKLVDVLIDKDRYEVATADDSAPRVVLGLDELIALVQTAPGDDTGVKIRISRTPNAIAMAESALLERLRSMGLNEDQIDQRRQLVETP